MKVYELITELLKVENMDLEVVTCDEFGSTDPIFQILIQAVDNRDNLVGEWDDKFESKYDKVVVIGWNI